jgi:hypothetical protein
LSDTRSVPDPIPPDTLFDPAFEALWLRVLEAWDDEKTHSAALEYALHAERLPVLAGRYRALKEDPTKGERAQKRLEAIVLAATALMMSMKSPRETKVPLPITLSAVGIFLLAFVFLLYAMWKR